MSLGSHKEHQVHLADSILMNSFCTTAYRRQVTESMHHNRRQRARAALSSPVSPGSTARSNHASVARSDGVTSEDFWRPREQDSYFLDAASSSSNVSRHNTDGSEQSQGAEATGSTPEAESLCSTPGSSGSAPDDRNWKVAPDDGPHGETWNGYGMVGNMPGPEIYNRD